MHFKTMTLQVTLFAFSLLIYLFAFASLANAQNNNEKKLEDLEKKPIKEIYSQPRINIEIDRDALNKEQRVSTAGRGDAQDPALVPATVVSITEELIESRAYQSLWDILQDLPGMKTDYNVLPESFNRTTFRGIVGVDKFLILLDGIRISSPTNEEIPILENYPVHLAKQVEILYGPASALYGADAFAGVINIITKTADDIENAEAELSAGMYGKFVGNVLMGHRFDEQNISFTLSGQYAFDRQPDMTNFYAFEYRGAPIDYETPITNYALQGNLQFEKLLGKDVLKFSYFQNQARAPSVAGMRPGEAVYEADNFMSHRILMGNINYYTKLGDEWQLNTLITASRYSLDPESGFQNLYTNKERTFRFAFGRMYQIEQLLYWNPKQIKGLSIAAGLTYQNFRSIPLSVDLIEPTRSFDNPRGVWFNTVFDHPTNDALDRPEGVMAIFHELNYTNFGGFIQGQYAPWKQNERLIITLGARLDRNSRFETEFIPRVGLVFAPWRGSQSRLNQTVFKFLFGKAFLEPSPQITFEQFGTFPSASFSDNQVTYTGSTIIHQPNANLQPQEANTFEFSIQTSIGALDFSFQSYYSRLTNLIISAPDEALTNIYTNRKDDFLLPDNVDPNDNFNTSIDLIQVNVNQDQGIGEVWGGGMYMSYTIPLSGFSQLKPYLAISHTNGAIQTFYNPIDLDTGRPNVDTVSSELPYITPWTFRLGLDAKWGKFNFSPRMTYLNTQYLESFNPNQTAKRQRIAGYIRFDFSATYTLNEEVSFFVKLENALDARYKHTTAFGTRVIDDLGDILQNEEFFRGAPQNPIRLSGGVRIQL